jgi:hypothetical protein
MRITVGSESSVRLVGHGIQVEADYLLLPGITVSPIAPVEDLDSPVGTIGEFRERLNISAMAPMANFSLEIEADRSGEMLAAKTWNALWLFYLLALACRRPVIPLYTAARYGNPRFGLANRNLIIRALGSVALLTTRELDWARDHADAFDALTRVDRFSRAMRAYGNAQYLFDDDAKIMLLWAGIEGLLGVDAELRRRISLHAAILHDGLAEAKVAYFNRIKKGYDVRSKVVHGASVSREVLRAGYKLADEVLVALLRKVVVLGRVPGVAELDDLAASASL